LPSLGGEKRDPLTYHHKEGGVSRKDIRHWKKERRDASHGKERKKIMRNFLYHYPLPNEGRCKEE